MSSIWNIKTWFGSGWTLETTCLRSLREERIDLDNRARRLLHELAQKEDERRYLEDAFVEAYRQGKSERKEMLAQEMRLLDWQLNSIPQRHAEIVEQMILLLGLERLKEEEVALRCKGYDSVFSADPEQLRQIAVTAAANGRLNMERVAELVEILGMRHYAPQEAALRAVHRRLEEMAAQRIALNAEGDAAIEGALEEIDRHLTGLPSVAGKEVL